MNSVNDIKIIKVKDAGNFKGTVYNLDLNDFEISEISTFYREKGRRSGHFHKGESKSRDPERLFLLQGKIKMIFTDKADNNKEVIIEPGDFLTVPKMIYHEYEILEDAIFIELRVKGDKVSAVDDVYSEEEF
jgi:mannose-6-phosphate isomerase-like protein (cupin superfamily)